MISTNCPGCGILVRMSEESAENNPVCPRCRTPLVATISPPASPPPPPPLAFDEDDEDDHEPHYRRRSKKGPPVATMIAIAVLAIGCVGGTIYAIKVAGENRQKAVARPVEAKKEGEENRSVVRRIAERIDAEDAIILAALIPVYFGPSLIALLRRHNNLAPIIIVNTFLGCIFVGWVLALAWSLSDMTPHRGRGPA